MSKSVVMAGWDDVPHLGEKEKETLYASIPPYQRDARSKGIPQLGSGAIYPIPESEIVVNDFELPAHWARGYALDVGWNKTACIFGALDRDTDTLYLYSEHYRGHAEPAIHAAAIKARGDWMPGVIDPAARGRGQRDGEQLLQDYLDLGLNITPAINAVESGIYKVWSRLSTGRLKVFKSCQNFLAEYRLYRRDEKGNIVKQNDHLQDCCVVGETKVLTSNGAVMIKDLIGKEGTVISRCGSALRFIGARKTIVDADVVSLQFSNGDKVVCTPDHPFLTPRGWVEAQDMTGARCYNGVTQRIGIESCKTPLLFLIHLKSSMVAGIIYAANTFSVMALDCIGWCGKMRMAKYLMAHTSTMPTVTEATITSKTWRRYWEVTTSACTKKGIKEAYLVRHWRRLKNGMDQKRACSGIRSIMKKWPLKCTYQENAPATSVAQNTLPPAEGAVNSVQTNAEQEAVSVPVLIMRNGIAWFVAWCLWRIVTLRKKHVHDHALVRCLAVADAGKSDVYCLTVPGASAFCIESGLVVHNTRYLCQEVERIDFMMTKPVAQNRDALAIPIVDSYTGY